LYFTC